MSLETETESYRGFELTYHNNHGYVDIQPITPDARIVSQVESCRIRPEDDTIEHSAHAYVDFLYDYHKDTYRYE